MTMEYTHEAYFLDTAGRELAPVLTMRLREDTGWMPRFSASVTVTTTPALMHPTSPPKFARLRMRRVDGPAIPLASWTDLWAGDLARMTAEGGHRPAAITQRTGGDSASGSPEQIEVEMLVRDYDHDLIEGTTVVNLTAIEMLMGDLRRLIVDTITPDPEFEGPPTPWNGPRFIRTPFTVPGTTVQEAVSYMIARTGIAGATLVEQPAPIPIDQALTWSQGESIQDALQPLLEKHDLVLWAETRTDWRLTARVPRSGITHTFTPDTNLITAHYRNDLGAADAVGGFDFTMRPDEEGYGVHYFGSAPGILVGAYRELTADMPRVAFFAPGSPNKKRTGSRVRTYPLTAASDYRVSADDRARVFIPAAGIDETGTVLSVEYEYPAGTAEITVEKATPYTP